MKLWIFTAALVTLISAALLRGADSPAVGKICGVYTNVIEFDSPAARDAAIHAQPSFLSDKHKRALAGQDSAAAIKLVNDGGFDALFMTIYPLWGKDWWDNPAARGLVKDALVQAKAANLRVHLGLSLFNAEFCANPSRYPGASHTVQCDGTRPSWVCFFDDALWKTYQTNVLEMATLDREVPGVLDGIFLDPEAYGPECYLCFCDECVGKFNRWSGQSMPAGLVKPDAWLHAHQLWKKYTVEWHDQEVRRHAAELRVAIHAIDPNLQLSSLLWDYPVAVGIGDARQQYFRMLAIGLGTKEKPSWTLPEHTYYSDGPDVTRIVAQIEQDITSAGAAGTVKVLPGIRLLRRDAASLRERGEAIKTSTAAGYWLYELADLRDKTPIDFEGALVDPPAKYVDALADVNRALRQRP
jgi:hypothetical protein